MCVYVCVCVCVCVRVCVCACVSTCVPAACKRVPLHTHLLSGMLNVFLIFSASCRRALCSSLNDRKRCGPRTAAARQQHQKGREIQTHRHRRERHAHTHTPTCKGSPRQRGPCWIQAAAECRAVAPGPTPPSPDISHCSKRQAACEVSAAVCGIRRIGRWWGVFVRASARACVSCKRTRP